MRVNTAFGVQKYAILIPSKGRSVQLARFLKRSPWLWHASIYLGIEKDEYQDYEAAFPEDAFMQGKSPTVVTYNNPLGSVAVARERLRHQALSSHRTYQWFLVTDDNATYTQKSADTLVRSAAEWRYSTENRVIMAGCHPTAAHFDRRLIEKTKEEKYGLTSYANIGMIFQVYHRDEYAAYEYPTEAYGLDDRHLVLWAIKRGVESFRICLDAPFNKSRYQPGGQGPVEARARKCGLAIARLATDFPDYVGATGTLRIPWQLILGMREGLVPDRLASGAMRKEDNLYKRRKG